MLVGVIVPVWWKYPLNKRTDTKAGRQLTRLVTVRNFKREKHWASEVGRQVLELLCLTIKN